jgi:prepilin-type N-terminal cleavage/methylation domain-containing protein
MKGFTLVEVLVAVGILSFFIFSIFAVMDVGRASWFTGSLATEVHREIIKPFTIMEKELRETKASQISMGSGEASASITFKVPEDIDNDGDVLDATGNIEWSGNITYALNSSNQITRTASGATSILANSITSLLFTRPVSPLNIVQVDVTARKTNALRRQIQEAGQIIIKMRN